MPAITPLDVCQVHRSVRSCLNSPDGRESDAVVLNRLNNIGDGKLNWPECGKGDVIASTRRVRLTAFSCGESKVTMVYVLDVSGSPLTPTKRHGKVRHLLKTGRAVQVQKCPFTIRLTYQNEGPSPKLLTERVDAGSKHVGNSVSSETVEEAIKIWYTRLLLVAKGYHVSVSIFILMEWIEIVIRYGLSFDAEKTIILCNDLDVEKIRRYHTGQQMGSV